MGTHLSYPDPISVDLAKNQSNFLDRAVGRAGHNNSAKVYVYTAFPTATINFATDLILPWFEGFRNKKTKKRQKN